MCQSPPGRRNRQEWIPRRAADGRRPDVCRLALCRSTVVKCSISCVARPSIRCESSGSYQIISTDTVYAARKCELLSHPSPLKLLASGSVRQGAERSATPPRAPGSRTLVQRRHTRSPTDTLLVGPSRAIASERDWRVDSRPDLSQQFAARHDDIANRARGVMDVGEQVATDLPQVTQLDVIQHNRIVVQERCDRRRPDQSREFMNASCAPTHENRTLATAVHRARLPICGSTRARVGARNPYHVLAGALGRPMRLRCRFRQSFSAGYGSDTSHGSHGDA